MPHDVLAQLLRSADASAPTPAFAADMPTRVRQTHTRRRRARNAAVITTTVTLLIAIAALLPLPGTPGSGQGRGASDATHLIALDRQASLHEQTANLLLAPRTVKPPASVAATPDDSVLSEIRQQRDRAALILVYEADRARDANQSDRALAAYERTIKLFPTTYWADVARQRLKEMST